LCALSQRSHVDAETHYRFCDARFEAWQSRVELLTDELNTKSQRTIARRGTQRHASCAAAWCCETGASATR